MKRLLLIAAMVLSASSAQALYKCTGSRGEVTYQDAPCAAGGGSRVDVRANVMEGRPAGDRQARSEAERNVGMRALINQGRVAIGMTERELVEAWGNPAKVNSDMYGGGRISKQWIYERGSNGTQYVYTQDGLVTSIQDRPGYVVAQERCYTSDEIRNETVGANSIALSTYEAQRRREAIARMKPC